MSNAPVVPGAVLTALEVSRLSELETVIERGLETYIEVGNALREIDRERLYRQGYGTFEQYVKERWGHERAWAYRQIDAAEVAGNVSTSIHLSTEQAIALAPLRPEQQRELAPIVAEKTVRETREIIREYRTALDIDQSVIAPVPRPEQWLTYSREKVLEAVRTLAETPLSQDEFFQGIPPNRADFLNNNLEAAWAWLRDFRDAWWAKQEV